MANQILANLTRTMQAFFRIGSIRIKDESGKVAMRNGADSANVDLAAKQVHVRGSNASNAVILTAPALGGSVTLTLPPNDGNSNDVLRTDGNGVLTWGAAGGGTFLSLTDTPASYSGQQGKVPIVNGAQNALEFASVIPGPGSTAVTRQHILTFSGVLSTGLNPLRLTNTFGVPLTITRVYLVADLAPTGAAIIVDVHKNGTTIFTNQANRPQIAAGQTTGQTTTIDVPTWAAGDELQVEIDQVGSTVAGADLVAVIDTSAQGNLYLDDLIDVDLTTPPSNGDALGYNGTSEKWEPIEITMDHGELQGLSDDDHTQYHNDTRGDARYSQLGHDHDDRYFTETEHIATGTGAPDAGKPIKLNASGVVDATMLPDPVVALDDLTDVDLTTSPPAHGQTIVFDDVSDTWVPGEASGGGGDTWVVQEDHSGECDGSTVTFSTDLQFVEGGTMVFLNGLLQRPGALHDYTEGAGRTSITFAAAPQSSDSLLIAYMKSAGDGGSGTIRQQALWSFEGTLSVGASPLRLHNASGFDKTIHRVFLSAGTAPSGAAIIVDIHRNGTTIFTTQANRPQIAIGEYSGETISIDENVWAAGQYLTAEIDQIGSTLSGENLVVHVVYS